MCVHNVICIVNWYCYYAIDIPTTFFLKTSTLHSDLSWHSETRSDIVPQWKTPIKVISLLEKKHNYAVQSSCCGYVGKRDNLFGKRFNFNYEKKNNGSWWRISFVLCCVIHVLSVPSFSLGRVLRIQRYRENLFVRLRKKKVLPFLK